MSGQVKFDARTWGRLATMAAEQNVTITELILAAAHRLVTGTRPSFRRGDETPAESLARTRATHREQLVKKVMHLREQGFSIMQIGDRLGYSKTHISRLLVDSGARTRTRSNTRSSAVEPSNEQEQA